MRRTALILVGLAFGCGAATPLSSDESNVRSNSSRSQAGALTLQLDYPTPVPQGKPITLKLTLKNTGKDQIPVYLGGRPPYDVIAASSSGTEVWRWSEGQVIQTILEVKELGPGEQIGYDIEWALQDNSGNPLSPGTYLVRGGLNLDPPDKLETTPKQLTITTP